MPSEAADWPAAVLAVMREKAITTVATVPDAGLTRLLTLCADDPEMRVVTLANEAEGIGIGLGLWLGGGRGLLAMQSSGVGNCVNALALPAVTRSPCLMLVTMRGETGETNPWQVPMGQGVRPVFEAMGVACYPAATAEAVAGRFRAAADAAFGAGRAAAVLVEQRVIGVKAFEK